MLRGLGQAERPWFSDMDLDLQGVIVQYYAPFVIGGVLLLILLTRK